jgi:DNA uptake protein ComE-like DNA-binding protein
MNKTVKKEWWPLVCAFFYLSCVPFFYFGKKCSNKLWIVFGVVYLVILGGIFAIDEQFKEASWFKSLLTVFWLSGMAHTYFTLDSYSKIKKELEQNNENIQYPNETNSTNQIKEHFENKVINSDIPSASVEIKQGMESKKNYKIIDVNSCDESDLISLPGVSIVLAKRVLSYRKEHDGFSSIEEFFDTMQLKPHFVVQIQSMVECKPIDKHVSTKENSTGRKLDL